MQPLVIGTAQWGMDYGLTNAIGRIPDAALAALVEQAHTLGVPMLDTAAAYGDAETRIRDAAPGFAVQTKVAALGLGRQDVVAAVRAGLDRLGVTHAAGCLVHDWPSLDAGEQVEAAAGLEAARAAGLVAQVGISAYEAADLADAAQVFGRLAAPLGAVQVPVSVLDQRLDGADVVAGLRAGGTQVQARSVFLQGIALGGASRFAEHPDVRRLVQAAADTGVDPIRLCLGYVRTREWVDAVVVAPTSAAELTAIHDAFTAPPPALEWAALASSDPVLVDPRRWPVAA